MSAAKLVKAAAAAMVGYLLYCLLDLIFNKAVSYALIASALIIGIVAAIVHIIR